MFTRKTQAALVLIALLSLTGFGRAQNQQQTPAPSDNYVTNTGFKNRVFEVHNRAPEDLIPVIRLLTSGFKGAQLSASNEFRTITVRDFPENIAAIEEAIKRLDKAEAARPDIELKIHVLLASNKETQLNPYPAELKDVISELQKTLTFRDYFLLTSIVQRTRESLGERGNYVRGEGTAEYGDKVPGGFAPLRTNYSYEASSVSLVPGSANTVDIQLGSFSFYLSGAGSSSAVRIRSDVRIREGEKVVVGTAGFGDKALILVMVARVIK